MYDHLGGGFHRYSVDGLWQIPHFEKMLYDNGQLASLTLRHTLIHQTLNIDTLWGHLRFTLRELQAPEGAFFSA